MKHTLRSYLPAPGTRRTLTAVLMMALLVLFAQAFASKAFTRIGAFVTGSASEIVKATGPEDATAEEAFVEVSWYDADPIPSTSRFVVERGGTLVAVSASTVFEYLDLNAVPGTTYEYCVSVRPTAGPDVLIGCDSGGRRIIPPSAFTASDGLFEDQVLLNWTDHSMIEAGYNIYRMGGRALMFDGVDDYVSTTTVDITGSFTFEFWAKRSSTNTPDFVLNIESPALGDPVRGDLEIGFLVDGRFSVGFGTDLLNSPAPFLDTQWNHWAVVHDAPNRRRMVFRNGELVMQDTRSTSFRSTGELEFGRRRKAGSAAMRGHYHGALDEVRLWSRALTPAEIETSMSSLLRPSEVGIRNYWPMDAESGLTAHDVIGALNGTLRNMPPTSWVASDVPPRYTRVGADIQTFSDRTAVPGFVYTYQVAAFEDANGDGRYTPGIDYESVRREDTGWRGILSPPGDVSATDGQWLDRVRVTWMDRSAAEEGFRVYRSEVLGVDQFGSDVLVGTVGPNQTSFDDMTAVLLQDYRYCVASFAAGVESVRACDAGRRGGLAAPTSVAASRDAFDDRIVVSWTAENGQREGFEVHRPQGTSIATVGPAAREHPDRTAMPGTDYEYCVRAFSNADPLSPSFSAFTCTTTPGRRAAVLPPSSITATPLEGEIPFEERVDLRWTNPSTSAMLFLLYRNGVLFEILDFSRTMTRDVRIPSDADIQYCVGSATVVNQNANAAQATVARILQDFRAQDAVRISSGLDASTPQVQMEAVFEALGFEAEANEVAVMALEMGYVESDTVCAIGRRSLNAPAITSISNDLESHVRIEWEDRSSHEAGFVIHRIPSGGPSELVTTLSANRTTHSDYQGVPGVNYTYSIYAFDDYGQSVAATREGVRTLKPPTQFTASDGTSETTVRLRWKDNSSSEKGYRVYRKVVGEPSDVLIATVGRNEEGFDDVVPATLRAVELEYRVAAFDDFGESLSATARGKTFILAPANVSASDVYTDRIVVVWIDRSAIEDNYILTRRQVDQRTETEIELPANATRHVDGSAVVTQGIEYQYCVRSRIDANGGFVLSDPVCDIGIRTTAGVAVGDPDPPPPGEGPVRLVDPNLTSARDGALRFGHSVALSDLFAFAGIPGADDNGRAGFYLRSTLTPASTAEATLLPAPHLGGEFGYAVAISGDYAVVGDPFYDDSNGALHVFKLSDGNWSRIAHRNSAPNLGFSVAIVDEFAIVGDNRLGGPGGAIVCNAETDPTCASAVNLGNLVDPPAPANAGFGFSVGVTRVTDNSSDSLYAIVGAPGQRRAYLFECDLSTDCNEEDDWSDPVTVTSPFTTGPRNFGAAVSIDGDVAVIGDPLSEGIAVWTRAGVADWNEQDFERKGVKEYGHAVAVRGTSIIVGAPGEQVGDRSQAGRIYVYDWTGSLANETPYDARVAGPLSSDARFGASVDVSSEGFFVGAPSEPGGGAAYYIPRGSDQPDDPIIPVEVDLNDPTRVRASDGTAPDRIQIRWTDNSDNEAGHVIYRSSIGGGFDRLAEVSADVEFYDDFSAAPGEAYTYCVAAFSLNPYVESGRACDIGWRPANGTIAGRVFTGGGAGTADAQVCLTPSMNRGLLFDGAGGHVLAPIQREEGSSSPLDFGQTLTIEAWIRPHSTDGVRAVLVRPQGYALVLEGGVTKFTFVESDGNVHTSSAGTALLAGVWYHVAVVKGIDNNVSFYVDGVFVNEDPRTLTLQVAGIDSLWIGQSGDNTGLFHGEIDELRVWSIARSAAEIQGRRFAALTGKEESLVGYWPMDEGLRGVVPDLTKFANHGHLFGGVYLADVGADLDICGRTASDGNYSISRIRYGETTEFDVAPTTAGRAFSPTFKKITLSLDSPVQNEVFFNDVTAYTVAGSILYQDIVNGDTLACPVPDVSIHVDKGVLPSDDNLKVVTREDGGYAVAVDPSTGPADPWYIIPRGPSTAAVPHTFTPANRELVVTTDTLRVDFFSTKRNTLALHFSGGEPGPTCGKDIGIATVRIFTQDGCYDRLVELDSGINSGFREIDLPPLEYLVQVIDVQPSAAATPEFVADVADFFERLGAVEVDLTEGNAQRNLTYRAPLTLVIAGLEPGSCPALTVNDKDGNPLRTLPAVRVIEEFDFVPLEFRVTENYGNGQTCNVGDGTVTIFDAIADRVDVDSTMTLKDGVVKYTTFGASPNIFSGARVAGVDRSFQKPITAVAQVEGRQALMETEWAIVEGFRERAATFVSATTEKIPLMILHDPPGSNSVASIEKGRTFCKRISSVKTVGGGAGWDLDFAIGFKADIGFSFMAHTATEVGGGVLIKSRTIFGRDNTSLGGGANIEICATTTDTWTTSDDPGWVGEDVVMGVALNLIFALADVLDANEQSCTVTLSETLATDLDSADPFETAYVYGRSHIEHTIIPQLANLIELGGDATLTGDIGATRESVRLRDALVNWQNHLKLIDKNKADGRNMKNHSFSGGVDVSVSENADTTRVTRLESTRIYINSENAIGVVFTAFYDQAFAVAFDVNAEWVDEQEDTESTSRTIGYTLSDGDGGDYFSVDIGKDPMFGTFVFNTVAGRSSNPCEENTQCRDNPIITVDPPVRHNVNPSQAAQFQLTLINASESNERRRYVLAAPPEKNPNNLELRVAGGTLTAPREYLLEAGRALTVNLDAYASPSARQYERVAVMLYPPDEWPIWAGAPSFGFEQSDTAFFSVFFDGSGGNQIAAQVAEGWNWFSINSEGGDLRKLLNGVALQHGDVLKSQHAESRYDSTAGWRGNLTQLAPGLGYRIRLKNPGLVRIPGDPVEQRESMEMSPGWSWIGYMPTRRLPVDQALASLKDRVMEGDLVVGQRSFAQYVEGTGWVGTMTDMLPGEAYAIHLGGGGKLLYPPESEDVMHRDPIIREITVQGPEWEIESDLYEGWMTVVGEVQMHGTPMRQTTMKVAAFNDEEIRGVGELYFVESLDRYLMFLQLFGDVDEAMPLVIHVYDGETDKLYESVASVKFEHLGRLGQPASPVVIDLANAGLAPEMSELPEKFALHQNFPNPFNQYTIINYDVPEETPVSMVIYDILGRRITTLVDEVHRPGRHQVVFHAQELAGGVYFYRMEIGDSNYVGRMVVVK